MGCHRSVLSSDSGLPPVRLACVVGVGSRIEAGADVDSFISSVGHVFMIVRLHRIAS